jgi:hypothetical protein
MPCLVMFRHAYEPSGLLWGYRFEDMIVDRCGRVEPARLHGCTTGVG